LLEKRFSSLAKDGVSRQLGLFDREVGAEVDASALAAMQRALCN
jgi:hypothetical protein